MPNDSDGDAGDNEPRSLYLELGSSPKHSSSTQPVPRDMLIRVHYQIDPDYAEGQQDDNPNNAADPLLEHP